MYEDNGSQINIKNKMIINNINDRYYNIDSKYTPKNKINSTDNNIIYNDTNNDEDLEIELDAISQKIPIENLGINNKEEKFIKLENNNNNNNNNKILPIQRKKRSKIHRHRSYDNLHDKNNINNKSKENNNINYTKINNQKRSIPNIKIANDNLRRDFIMQNENINNKTEYDLYRGIHNKQYENNIINNKNTIDAKINKISYFQNYNDKIDLEINNENNEFEEKINNNNKNNFGISNLINLKAVHNNNNNYIINEFQNLMNKNEVLDENNFKNINNLNNEEHQKEENKYIDDESLVEKIENKLKNKFEKNEVDDYINRTPNIRNSSINYFENELLDNYEGIKSKSPNANDILFKPTNIINSGKNKDETYNDYTKDKIQNNKLINQIKKLKEENKSLKTRNEKLSNKIFQIEKEQKKKNNTELSLLQRIKKLENQLNQKNIIISKLTNRNNFNNIKAIKIISFFIRNKNNYKKNFSNFKNLRIKNVENIRFFPDYIKDSIYEKIDNNNSNEEENFEKENDEVEFDEDDEIKNINNDNEEFEIDDENYKNTINNKDRIRSLKKNKSNKIFSSVTNKIKNNYKHSSSISNNNTININKIYYKNENYHHSLPVSNKKKQKNSGKKSIYEFFEKSSNNKDSIESNKGKNRIIKSKKNSKNKYNQNYNINFYKNNCYGNNFINLFKNEEDNNIHSNNNIKDNINNKKEKHQTSLIMSVINDNLLGNMNFNIANNSKNKDIKKNYK